MYPTGARQASTSRWTRGGVTAVPAMVRDLDGIASVFLTDLAPDAAMVVREGGVKRFGTGTLVMSGEPAPPPFLKDSLRALSARGGDGRTIGRDDILAAKTRWRDHCGHCYVSDRPCSERGGGTRERIDMGALLRGHGRAIGRPGAPFPGTPERHDRAIHF